MKTLKLILALLTPKELHQAKILLAIILIMAFLDMLGVASIMPFMAVLANPELIETNSFLKALFQAVSVFGVTNEQNFLFVLGVLVFTLLVVSLAFKALTTYYQLRFTLMREYSIGKRLLKGYLSQPYSWFLNRNSADMGKTIISEVQTVINYAIKPMLNLIAQSAVAIALLVLLIIVDIKLAFVVGITLTSAYILIYRFTRIFIAKIGDERLEANKQRFITISEAFGSAKDLKLNRLEDIYIRRFSSPAKTYAKHQASAQIIGQLPRFALEAIAFGGMLLVVLYHTSQSGGMEEALPVVSLYAFAGYRIMPALQQIYSSTTQLRFIGSALQDLNNELIDLQQNTTQYNRLSRDLELDNQTSIKLRRDIVLNNVCYSYPGVSKYALSGINLTIHANSKVGIVGGTGSGKTTVVDIILGLLDPQQGVLEVDGRIIDIHNKDAWQYSIDYVPQQIYLSDDTIAANIAFGANPEEIDYNRVKQVAKSARLHEFVENELPQQYDTIVGERGSRLSGGQRQRIGIARALYNNPQVLVLDEATSALDNLTEQAVMDAIHNLGKDITIILIAHRLSTIKECDQIFLMEKGSLRSSGTFEQLKHTDSLFQKMIKSTA